MGLVRQFLVNCINARYLFKKFEHTFFHKHKNRKYQQMTLKYLFFRIFLLCTVILINSQVLLDDKYVQFVDNTIPQPLLIQIDNQQIPLTAQATIPISIYPPQQISPVYYSTIHSKPTHNCTHTQLEAQKLYGDYIKFKNQQLGRFNGWPISILDATYSLKTQTVHAVLTNGSLIKVKLRKQATGSGNHVTSFQVFDYHKTEKDAIWELDQYSMYTSEEQIYLLRQKQLFKAVFEEGNKWGMIPLPQGDNINRVHQQFDEIYIIKSDNIYKIINEQVGPSLLKLDNYPNNNLQFADVDIDNGVLYALSKIEGVMMFNITKNYKFISSHLFDFNELGNRIYVMKSTVLIHFKLYRKSFIGEFFLIPSELEGNAPDFKLNKFYYRFDEMHHVVLFQEFGLVYSLSEINFFQHSVNRNIPFGELETSNIYTASYPKVLDVIPLDQKNLHYILVQKNGIFVESFGNADKGNLLKSRISCLFRKSGKYQLKVKYQGFCRQKMNPRKEYCTKQETYQIDVNDQKQVRQVQAFNEHMFVGLILAVAFVLVLGAILAYRKITIQNRERLYALLAQKKRFDEMGKENVQSEATYSQKKAEMKKEGDA